MYSHREKSISSGIGWQKFYAVQMNGFLGVYHGTSILSKQLQTSAPDLLLILLIPIYLRRYFRMVFQVHQWHEFLIQWAVRKFTPAHFPVHSVHLIGAYCHWSHYDEDLGLRWKLWSHWCAVPWQCFTMNQNYNSLHITMLNIIYTSISGKSKTIVV